MLHSQSREDLNRFLDFLQKYRLGTLDNEFEKKQFSKFKQTIFSNLIHENKEFYLNLIEDFLEKELPIPIFVIGLMFEEIDLPTFLTVFSIVYMAAASHYQNLLNTGTEKDFEHLLTGKENMERSLFADIIKEIYQKVDNESNKLMIHLNLNQENPNQSFADLKSLLKLNDLEGKKYIKKKAKSYDDRTFRIFIIHKYSEFPKL